MVIEYVDLVFRALEDCLSCKKCRKSVRVEECASTGLSSVFNVVCEKCGIIKTFRNSETLKKKGIVVAATNRRMVYALRSLGIGYAGMKKLCALLDLPPAVSESTYNAAQNDIHEKIQEVAELSMVAAMKEEANITGSKDVKGSGDGTWQRRGFSSKHGVVTLIGLETGKVLDVYTMSKVCKVCSSYTGPKSGEEYEEWWHEHEPYCSINHEGSSGMMEVSGMLEIFKRSIDRGGVRIKTYIGDGDAKTYPNILKAKPYGDELLVEKAECTVHVQKRMGTRLRKLKTELKGKKLKDGKPIGGKGRLTDKMIDRISSYYGNAIRNHEKPEDMKNAVWAIFYHYRSSDKHPQHHLCPKGKDTWCKYNRAVYEKKVRQFQHKSSLPEAVMDATKKVFQDLTADELLNRCIGGYTQNPNESLNAIIWKLVPKTVFVGKKVVEIGVSEAVLVFNHGQKSKLDILRAMGIEPGKFCVAWVNQEDMKRKKGAKRKSLKSTKEARVARRRIEKERAADLEQREGQVYGAGIA